MTVHELILRLQGLDPDTRVVVRYPSGDYWRTELARDPMARGEEEGFVKPSEYHGGEQFVEWEDAFVDGGEGPDPKVKDGHEKVYAI